MVSDFKIWPQNTHTHKTDSFRRVCVCVCVCARLQMGINLKSDKKKQQNFQTTSCVLQRSLLCTA